MPFSFKPEVASQEPQTAQAVSSVPVSALPSMSLMNRGSKTSLIQVLLIIILTGCALIAGGMFGYSYYLSSQIDAKKEKLTQIDDGVGAVLSSDMLPEMRDLSSRIKIVNQLITQHPSVNVAFKIIEDSVENQVTYKNFSLNNAGGKGYTLSLSGVAPDYKTVVQQLETLKRKPYTAYISGVKVTNLSPDDVGRINFSLSMNVSISGLSPESLNLSAGAAEFLASSTPITVASSTPIVASSTNVTASSTKK